MSFVFLSDEIFLTWILSFLSVLSDRMLQYGPRGEFSYCIKKQCMNR